MSDSTLMTGTIGGRVSGGWSAQVLRDIKGRTATCDWRSLVFGQRVAAFGDACIDTRCANVLPIECWNGANQTAPSWECCLRTPASRSGRREAVSLQRRPPFRNVGTFGSDHQWGNVEKASAECLQCLGHGAERSLIRLMGNIPTSKRRRNPSCLVRRRFHAAGGRASRQLPG